MKRFFKNITLKPIPFIFTDKTGEFINRLLTGKLKKEIMGEVTDKFLLLLLNGMNFALYLSKGFRKNIKNFTAGYIFNTADGEVMVSASFKNGEMKVHDRAIENWNAQVTYKNAKALRDFLFSRNQDILNSLLANEVEVKGNLNYIYRFGFLARDLTHRLGMG